ncbi:integral membrane protein, PqiA family [Gluconacetobacter diazotrophicus PA1 5]|uniref:Paraquat-inducible protein A n=3 Tax=Gluconacetobacter diazotrophicus TaxID=33996 RepID=A0A7W4I684_GLUDI|nr:integral membrane protein, PqiA family [Gluconacetobacter diazotrophicus PA1 5]MBB2157022.1 paraquat-inducible protein A [Gluconacetobacter diazotrophicus]CAP54628.1 putative paraquat-inducible protein [Gluconacetobacter diazotrophicus PA1 5]
MSETISGRTSRMIRRARWPRRAADLRHVRTISGLVECRGCGLFQCMPSLQAGQLAECARCGQTLEWRRRTSPLQTPLAFCISSCALYLAALLSSLMTLNVYGRERTVSLVTGPMELLHEGWGEAGVLVGLVTIAAPAVVIGMMFAILYAASRRQMPDWAPHLLIWYEKLRPWSMIEVYVLGIFVAYTKLTDLAHVDVGPAVYLISALMLTMAASDSTLDTERIWRHRRVDSVTRMENGRRVEVDHCRIEDIPMPPADHLVACPACGLVGELSLPVSNLCCVGVCPRCDHRVWRRSPETLARTTAFLISAITFYFPANLYPVMTFFKIGGGGGHTIIEGAIELWQDGMIPLSLLVFFASIVVPMLKIISLSWMVGCTWRGTSFALVQRTRLFRIVDIIGRWSMIDVFMVSILVAVVRFNSLANVTANAGMVSFAAVVVLTLFAAWSFDPRVMWDAAGLNGPSPDDVGPAAVSAARPRHAAGPDSMEPRQA